MKITAASKRIATAIIDAIKASTEMDVEKILKRDALAKMIETDIGAMLHDVRQEALLEAKKAVEVLHMDEVDKVNNKVPVESNRHPRHLAIETSSAAVDAIDKLWTGGQ